ncbi:9868_t:CDS:1, partial [Funneliformis geosporum]
EFHHQMPGNDEKGSVRSDFACVVISHITKKQYPFFILKFEIGGMQAHKDFAVVVAKAAHALNCILSMHMLTELKISLI